MKAVVVTTDHDLVVREWQEPTPGPGEVLVTPLLVGLCGTDLELVDATIDPAYVRYPLVLGHEWVGRLKSAHATLGPAGTNVVVEGIVFCGKCDECRRGDTNRCAIYDEIGFTRPGALANVISVPEDLVHPLGDDVAIDNAVLTEPMAVVWRALTRLPLREGLKVAVIGDGTIALLSAHMVQLFQPATTTVFGRREEQRDLALEAGATAFATTAPTTQFDLVIEASGSVDGVTTALEHCARGGMVILLGLPPHGSVVAFGPDDLVNNDLIIQASFSYTRKSFTDVVRRVNALELRPGFLLTHRYAFDDAVDAIEALRSTTTQAPRGKVVVEVSSRLTPASTS